MYDGYLVHSRGDGGAALSQAPQPDAPAPAPTSIRTDLTVPVMTFTTETDLINSATCLPANPTPSASVTGRSPARPTPTATRSSSGPKRRRPIDADVAYSRHDAQPVELAVSTATSSTAARRSTPAPRPTCSAPPIAAMNRWVTSTARHRRGAAAPDRRQPRQRLCSTPHGNAQGRHPHPARRRARRLALGSRPDRERTSAASSAPPRRSTRAKLATLYPSHAAFVKAWNAATDRAVKAGFVLPADAKDLKAAAAQSTVGG